jgi:hypothetical protein
MEKARKEKIRLEKERRSIEKAEQARLLEEMEALQNRERVAASEARSRSSTKSEDFDEVTLITPIVSTSESGFKLQETGGEIDSANASTGEVKRLGVIGRSQFPVTFISNVFVCSKSLDRIYLQRSRRRKNLGV